MHFIEEVMSFFKRMGGKSGVDNGAFDLTQSVFGLEGQVIETNVNDREIVPRKCWMCGQSFHVTEYAADLIDPEHPLNICRDCLDYIAKVTENEDEPLPADLLRLGERALKEMRNRPQ